MVPADLRWLAYQIETKITRVRHGTERERELLRRSYEQIALSLDLLAAEAPQVSRPEPPPDLKTPLA